MGLVLGAVLAGQPSLASAVRRRTPAVAGASVGALDSTRSVSIEPITPARQDDAWDQTTRQPRHRVLVAGEPLTCIVCRTGQEFERREVNMNTKGMTFLNLDWLNKSGDGADLPDLRLCPCLHGRSARVGVVAAGRLAGGLGDRVTG